MKRNNWNLVTACLAATLVSVSAHAQSIVASGDDKEAILDTIAQINHINWVVNVIKTYDNAMILEEEYEKISYGNLNLNRIPDEETRGRITNMLDTLYSLRKDEREMKHWRGKFWDERMRKMRDYDLESAKRVWGLFREGILGFMSGDIGTMMQTAFDVGHGCLRLQYDYDNFVHSFDQKMQEQVFSFDSQKIALLHKLNKEMLDDQWRLVRKFHLDDKTTRVTDTDIKALLSALKDDNASRIYTRLASMKSRYRLFPEYWYYLSCAAMETGHFKEGRYACDTFFKVNRGIFRDDPMAGTVALNKAMMLDKGKDNLPELKHCLEITWSNNQSRCEWKQDFIVASLYDGILHDNKKAVEILEHAIAGLESEMSERKRMSKDIIALGKDLGEYHTFLFRLLPNEPMPAAIRASEFISFSDKLRYLSRDKGADVWETIKNDILGVLVDLNDSESKPRATIPASWFLTEKTPVKFGYSVGEITVMLDEKVSKRKSNANGTFSLEFDGSKLYDEDLHRELVRKLERTYGVSIIGHELPDAPNVRLIFDHPEFPVVLTFAQKGMNFRTDDSNGQTFLFEFSVSGKKYFWQPMSGLDTPRYSSDVTSQQRNYAFTFRYAFVPLDRNVFACPDHWVVNGVKLVKVMSGKEASIEYRNVTSNNFRPLVTLAFINEYGMLISSEKDYYYDNYTKSHRRDPGIIFDDQYTDYNYKYMSPYETRTFSSPKPINAKYLLILVEVRHNLTETREGTW